MKAEDEVIGELGKPYSEELGINLDSGRDGEVFRWFLASILFGKRISEGIAANTYLEFKKADLLAPQKILNAGWDRLVELLDAGGYVRYDFSTASKLLEIMKGLIGKYNGSLIRLYRESKDDKDLERRLLEFKGVGPVTVNIFLRELRHVWKRAEPEISLFTKTAAKNMGIDLNGYDKKSKTFVKLECALLRLGKNWCRKGKCENCGFRERCNFV
jgi:endonuclease III